MSTSCRTLLTQMLEPDEDVLVGTSGSRDESMEENGSVVLITGQEEVKVLFNTRKYSNDYEFSALYIEAPQLAPEAIQPVVVLRTPTGFTVELGGSPTTDDCILYWRVRVRDTSPISPATELDKPEGTRTQLQVGAISQVIPFVSPRSGTDYRFSEFRAENLVDGNNQRTIWVQLMGKTADDFTVSINPPVETDNYFLVWHTA